MIVEIIFCCKRSCRGKRRGNNLTTTTNTKTYDCKGAAFQKKKNNSKNSDPYHLDNLACTMAAIAQKI